MPWKTHVYKTSDIVYLLSPPIFNDTCSVWIFMRNGLTLNCICIIYIWTLSILSIAQDSLVKRLLLMMYYIIFECIVIA